MTGVKSTAGQPASDSLLKLSKSQALILAGQQLQPLDPLYNMVFTFRISGAVDVDVFAAAFEALVDRCDTLRTVIVDTDEGSRQHCLQRATSDHLFEDFSTCADPELECSRWVAEQSRKCFDIGESLFESALLKLSAGEFVWYFNQHHLLTDAWTVSLIFRKLEELYRLAGAGGQQGSLPLRTAAQPVDVAATSESSPLAERARQYWQDKQQLAGKVSRFYRDTPASMCARTRRYPCRLGPERSRRLESLITRPGICSFSRQLSCMQVFTTVLSAYLHRISGRETLAIGTPSHSRVTAELRESVGLLINVFPLHVRVEKGDSFAELYSRVSRANQELLMYAQPEAVSAQGSRAFDVLLNYIPSSFSDFADMPVVTDWVHPGYGDRDHLLRMQIHDFDQSGEFTLLFDLNEEAFVGEEAEWVIEHYLCLLDAMLAHPERQLAEPPLFTDDDGGAGSRRDDSWPRQREIKQTVVTLLEEQFQRVPGNVALCCSGGEYTYAELDSRSAQLAAVLGSRGMGSESVAAVLMARSVELVVAAIAVLRSGATLLPLDPEYPDQRNQFMLRDSGAALLLSTADAMGQLHWPAERVLLLDRDRPEIEQQCMAAWRARADLDGRAYIIYTSGSTGRPKGVAVGHRALSNYIAWARDYYLRGRTLDFPLFTPVCFDLTITSLFTPLVSGGRLVIYPEPTDGGEITVRKVIEDNAVDIIKLTPAHLSLIRTMDLSRSRLSALIVGGEDFKTDIAGTVSEYLGGSVDIYNEYGPTEATVGCTVHHYDPCKDKQSSVPIGRPISNARIYVLDEFGNQVPRGVAGEIHIAGAGLADAYLNQPELTSERFPADPFKPGGRIYRSGDLGRWSHLGYLEYLGRTDQQVKIRGVRIETAEIESALIQLDSVTEAVVDVVAPLQAVEPEEQERRCSRCGIESRHPAAQLDESSICRICRVYERNRTHAQAYFRPLQDLKSRIADIRAQASGKQDSLMLLSGGKDSSYALCRLVDLGLTPLVFTLDNGYISEAAMANTRRLVDKLGLELVVGSTPAMDSIFVDSLTRHSNVCNGCFKTIYTLSMKIARERGIGTICTGLSRGQIFETRVAHLFQQGIYDPLEIDHQIVEARKAYHRVDDVIARTMDVSIFEDDRIFEEVDFLDFYRYTEVTLDEIYDYLHSRAPWIRPTDTGRSTNCLINDAGIHVHKLERGYHNYALPYSWDVRLGHKQREAAVGELEDEIDSAKVDRILGDIGYAARKPAGHTVQENQLIAYYVADDDIPAQQIKERLGQTLPAEYIPRQFIRLQTLPLTSNGKVDREALPRPQLSRQELAGRYAAPQGETEGTLVNLWQRMLGIDEVGVEDNFFELGGDSIINVQIVAAAREAGVVITAQQLFDHPTVRELALVAKSCTVMQVDQAPVVGEVALLPAQRCYFADSSLQPEAFSQTVVLRCQADIKPATLRSALCCLAEHHDALRSRFVQSADGWRQFVLPPGAVSPGLAVVDVSGALPGQQEALIESQLLELRSSFNLAAGELVQAAYLHGAEGHGALLLLAVNHLVVDGVSWWILLEDLERICEQLESGAEPELPQKTVSVARWGASLETLSSPTESVERVAYWLRTTGLQAGIPHDAARIARNTRDSIQTCSVSLDRGTTTRLSREVPGSFGLQVQEMLIGALLRGILAWSGNAALNLDMEGIGRSDPLGLFDPLRTVGYFTSHYPLTLRLSPGGDAGDDLRAIKEQLRSVPYGGVEYGVFRHPAVPNDLATELAARPEPQVLFDYLGQWDLTPSPDSRFSFARPIQAFKGSSGQRRHLLEINALIFDGRLQIDWQFSENIHRVDEIQRLADESLEILRELIDYCLSSERSGATPSDFPSAGLDQHELDKLLEEFGESP